MCMSVYIYIYIYIHTYVHITAYICIHICMYVHKLTELRPKCEELSPKPVVLLPVVEGAGDSFSCSMDVKKALSLGCKGLGFRLVVGFLRYVASNLAVLQFHHSFLHHLPSNYTALQFTV